jgi:two-component system chemotaxis response regulator CheB
MASHGTPLKIPSEFDGPGKETFMANRDIIVVGGSAGALEMVYELVGSLKTPFPAAVFVTLHMPPYGQSRLHDVLTRRGPLPAVQPSDGNPIELGKIYVASPDRHLLVSKGIIRVVHGPRENNARPAIDPLFRTAGVAYGERVIGVLLSGLLDDGVTGLRVIKSCGGLAVVQEPKEAPYPDMPNNALQELQVDQCLPVAEIAAWLNRVAPEAIDGQTQHCASQELRWEADMADWDLESLDDAKRPGKPSPFVCPHCRGTLWETGAPEHAHFRCRTGHAWSALTLLSSQGEALEETLNEAFRALKEKEHLTERFAKRAREHGNEQATRYYASELERFARFARTILDMLKHLRHSGEKGAPQLPAQAPESRDH